MDTEQIVAEALTKMNRTIEALVQERDALKSSNETYITLANTAYEITEQRTSERDTYQHEADKLAAEYKVLRDALKDMLDGNDKSFRELCRQARAALQGANHD